LKIYFDFCIYQLVLAFSVMFYFFRYNLSDHNICFLVAETVLLTSH